MLISKMGIGVLVWVAVSVSATRVLADVPATLASESVATEKSTYEKISEKALVTYYGYYRGASISDPGNTFNPADPSVPANNNLTDLGAPQSVESSITAGYKFNKKTSLALVGHFYWFSSSRFDDLPNGDRTQLDNGSNFMMLDPSIRFNRAGLIDTGGFKLNTALTYSVPLTGNEYISKHSYLGTLTSIWVASYDVPRTKLNVSLYSFVAAYLPSAGTDATARTYRVVAAPYASYSFLDNLQATVWVDLLDARRHGQSHFIGGLADNVGSIDIEPGFNWDINKYVSVNPFLNFYPSNPTLAATSFQMAVSARAF